MRSLRTYRSVRLSIVRETASEPYASPPKIRSAGDCVALLRALIAEDPREHFLAIYLDAKYKVLAIHIVSVGIANKSMVHPREVFAPALMLSATAIIVAHNHPSGCSVPSDDDRSITERLRKAGELLGIEVLDHIILGENDYYSFADEGTHRCDA
jgi:DNA repair protein RadC